MFAFIRKFRDTWFLTGVELHLLNMLPLHGEPEKAMVRGIIAAHRDDIFGCRDAGVPPKHVACVLADQIWRAVRAHA